VLFSPVSEVLPIAELRRDTSNITAVVGGPVYRGSIFPSLNGQVIFGDYLSR